MQKDKKIASCKPGRRPKKDGVEFDYDKQISMYINIHIYISTTRIKNLQQF